MKIDMEESKRALTAAFDAWFVRLQALTKDELHPDEWVERWFDGYTPEAALEDWQKRSADV